MKVYIDEDECIGCGTCEGICPEVFRLDADTGKARVIDFEGCADDVIQDAIDSCPVSCIHREE